MAPNAFIAIFQGSPQFLDIYVKVFVNVHYIQCSIQCSVIWHMIYVTFIYRNMNGLCYKYIVFDKTDLYLIRNPTRLTSLICWSMICMDYESRIYILQRKWLQPTNYDLKLSETSFDGSSLEWTVFG